MAKSCARTSRLPCYVIRAIIIHSKCFPVSNWLKPHAQFTINSCCWPRILSLNHWRQNDVKSAARCRLLNHWRQRLLNHWPKRPGHKVVSFNKERNGCEYSLQVWAKKTLWMNNKAIIEFGFRRIWRIDNTLLDLQNSSYPTQPHSIIAKYSLTFSWRSLCGNLAQSELCKDDQDISHLV